MTTVTYLIIAGIVLGMLCGALAIWGRGRYRELSSVFLVVGILVLAIGVTVQQVSQYRQQRLVTTEAVGAPAAAAVAGSGGSLPPPSARPVAILPPLGMRGPTGAAAPAAANPGAAGTP